MDSTQYPMENMSAGNDKPVLIYDDDCGFCRLWVSRWSPFTQDAVIYHPSQDVAENYPQISPQQFESSVYFVASDGNFCSGLKPFLRPWLMPQMENGFSRLMKIYQVLPQFRNGVTDKLRKTAKLSVPLRAGFGEVPRKF